LDKSFIVLEKYGKITSNHLLYCIGQIIYCIEKIANHIKSFIVSEKYGARPFYYERQKWLFFFFFFLVHTRGEWGFKLLTSASWDVIPSWLSYTLETERQKWLGPRLRIANPIKYITMRYSSSLWFNQMISIYSWEWCSYNATFDHLTHQEFWLQ
jgi:hypothetical protein